MKIFQLNHLLIEEEEEELLEDHRSNSFWIINSKNLNLSLNLQVAHCSRQFDFQ